tara:strand:- start:2176 stop:2412 length:237 start_codon:yes stop_codon:yes gene_type:complete
MPSCQFRGHRALYTGANATELMAAARDDSLYAESDLQAWMDAYSHRMKMWDGSKVSTKTPEEFVLDLRRCGELRVWAD